MAPSSIYGSRSMTSINSQRSRGTITHSLPKDSRQLKIKWWQRRPLIHTAIFTDLQKGSYFAAIYTLIQCLIQIGIAIFDAYCLIEARPGTRHFRSFGISFLFVYSGNEHIRRALIASCVLLFASAIYLLIASIVLMAALRKEHEAKFKHWIRSMSIFIIIRTLTLIFQSLLNDLYFTYHQFALVFWALLTILNVFVFLVVVSNFQELSDITRLEDMAKLKMSTISSLNASRSLSRGSLDSYKGAGGGVNLQPSPNVSVHGTPGSLRGSLGSTSSYNYPQPSPRTAAGGGGGAGHPSSLHSFPLAAFGFNLNPTGHQPSTRSNQGSTGGGSASAQSAGRGSTPSTVPI